MSLESLLKGTSRKYLGSESGLEGKLNGDRESFGSALKKFTWWDRTKTIGLNAFGAVFSGGLFGFGALNVLATTASFVTAYYLVNRRKGFSKNGLQTELVLGSVYTPTIYGFFNLISPLTPNPLLWMAAYAAGLYPFTVVTHAMKYMIEKYSPSTFIKGIFKGEPLKDIKYIAKDAITTSVKSSAKAALWLTLPVAGSHYFLPDEYLIASLYPIRTAYRYILETQEQKKASIPSYTALPRVSYNPAFALPKAA